MVAMLFPIKGKMTVLFILMTILSMAAHNAVADLEADLQYTIAPMGPNSGCLIRQSNWDDEDLHNNAIVSYECELTTELGKPFRFITVEQDDGVYYQILSQDGLCLDRNTSGGSPRFGNAYFYECHGRDNQLFRLSRALTTTASQIIVKDSGQCLDKHLETHNLYFNECHGGGNQRFNLNMAPNKLFLEPAYWNENIERATARGRRLGVSFFEAFLDDVKLHESWEVAPVAAVLAWNVRQELDQACRGAGRDRGQFELILQGQAGNFSGVTRLMGVGLSEQNSQKIAARLFSHGAMCSQEPKATSVPLIECRDAEDNARCSMRDGDQQQTIFVMYRLSPRQIEQRDGIKGAQYPEYELTLPALGAKQLVYKKDDALYKQASLVFDGHQQQKQDAWTVLSSSLPSSYGGLLSTLIKKNEFPIEHQGVIDKLNFYSDIDKENLASSNPSKTVYTQAADIYALVNQLLEEQYGEALADVPDHDDEYAIRNYVLDTIDQGYPGVKQYLGGIDKRLTQQARLDRDNLIRKLEVSGPLIDHKGPNYYIGNGEYYIRDPYGLHEIQAKVDDILDKALNKNFYIYWENKKDTGEYLLAKNHAKMDVDIFDGGQSVKSVMMKRGHLPEFAFKGLPLASYFAINESSDMDIRLQFINLLVDVEALVDRNTSSLEICLADESTAGSRRNLMPGGNGNERECTLNCGRIGHYFRACVTGISEWWNRVENSNQAAHQNLELENSAVEQNPPDNLIGALMVVTRPEYDENQIGVQPEPSSLLETQENLQEATIRHIGLMKRNQRYVQLAPGAGPLEEAKRVSETGAHMSSEHSFKHPSGDIHNSADDDVLSHEKRGSNPPKENRPRLVSNGDAVVKPETHSPKRVKSLLRPAPLSTIVPARVPAIEPLTKAERESVINVLIRFGAVQSNQIREIEQGNGATTIELIDRLQGGFVIRLRILGLGEYFTNDYRIINGELEEVSRSRDYNAYEQYHIDFSNDESKDKDSDSGFPKKKK